MANELERRIERLEAMLRGPTGEVREEAEMRARLYDAFKRHKTGAAPKPHLDGDEKKHWEDLEVYFEAARRVDEMCRAQGTVGG